ncbi:hypothetical protein F2P81_018694 [Scophthalmus maximus]|uniref:Uncharacterized protein n=1 Tax=Scophthalmus maximus TaxID=52904 RepID=A0A6A4SAF6_SCOMX|nr:hypothetical protein F2P81_018694 [Scophthalmus maximus]
MLLGLTADDGCEWLRWRKKRFEKRAETTPIAFVPLVCRFPASLRFHKSPGLNECGESAAGLARLLIAPKLLLFVVNDNNASCTTITCCLRSFERIPRDKFHRLLLIPLQKRITATGPGRTSAIASIRLLRSAAVSVDVVDFGALGTAAECTGLIEAS